HFDSNFSFRYACRGAICGSCGMTIDKVPLLACKIQVTLVKEGKKQARLPELTFGEVPSDWNPETEILIEPLPNMDILKDLVVDMDRFWEFYEEVQPYFVRDYNDEQPESLQSPEDARSIEHLVYCILCGICWACPVNADDPRYLGPAALAKGYRFMADTRIFESQKDSIKEIVGTTHGVPACEKHFVCNRVCPKGVKPGTAIQDTRKNFLASNP
ncbi:MAG: succinate dehydrogenase/fumarate reductase iron-sulfur subunit, partial [Candidatus Hodarchaeales archaeon]